MIAKISDDGISTSLDIVYEMPPSNIDRNRIVKLLEENNFDINQLLTTISTEQKSSVHSLHILNALLKCCHNTCPTLDVIKCFTLILKNIPTEAKTNKNNDLSRLIDKTSETIKQAYNSLSQFINEDERPALRTPDVNEHMSHTALRRFVDGFKLPDVQKANPVVAIAIPNGHLLAATCIAVATYYRAAPINPAAGSEQFRADVCQASADIIITTKDEYEKLDLSALWVNEKGMRIFIVDSPRTDTINLQTSDGRPLPSCEITRKSNKADDIGLILFTSGTSGTKKVVPLTIHSIIVGVSLVIDTWGLTADDICLNMMPLYHVGGLVRNILAPIFSGGSTICCSTFSASAFWDIVESIQPTWYYASPSMHSLILGEHGLRDISNKSSRMRLVCNAAGGLLPSLACQLRDTFDCVVLPSYGMTECMPISTPPLTYQLEREGTSGISTGPDLAILDWDEEIVPPDTIGRICVRGQPVFPGYLKSDGTYDRSPFNRDGWFDTGDLGYLDHDGYLYITGRSKEVINRGGEIISPFEIENSIISASRSSDSPISGRVTQALAFSVPHNVLQEVVGVVLVTPRDVPRVDLKAVHNALKLSLQQAKWPVLITYMDDLPKNNNKVLRIKLGQRLGLPPVTDNTTYMERHWQASCPAPDTSLSVEIPSEMCVVDHAAVSDRINDLIPNDYTLYRNQSENGFEIVLAPVSSGLPAMPAHNLDQIREQLVSSVHNYMIPSQMYALPRPIPRTDAGEIDMERLQMDINSMLDDSLDQLFSSTERLTAEAFATVLSIPLLDIPRDVDFFNLGGDSLGAGRLMSILRNQFQVQMPISLVFSQGTVMALAAYIDKMSGQSTDGDGLQHDTTTCTKVYSSTNMFLMIIQLVPLAVIYPLRRALQWTAFVTALGHSHMLPTKDTVVGKLVNLVVSMLLARIFLMIFDPLFGILAKWVIIGRFREGLYPMWGPYHTRWWLVQKITSICDSGIFSSTNATYNWYLRLMGAKIGKNVTITEVGLGEWDLLDIGDNSVITTATCRPFAVEKNTAMYLGRIKIGEGCTVGMGSIIAPGTDMPPRTCLGHNSSSWEMQDADEEYRQMLPTSRKRSHWLLQLIFTGPLFVIGWIFSLVPWLAGLLGMVIERSFDNTLNSPVRAALHWFSGGERIGYHFLALALRVLFAPLFLFAFTVIVKLALDLIFGILPSVPDQTPGTVSAWRMNLIHTLCPPSTLRQLTDVFGQHYEATSIALRMLGARVGKRVYWPGSGPTVGDYHLLDVGNDVVFGSRSHIITSDGIGSSRVVIEDGSMIADRVCLLPGVEIGRNVTMGSGAVTRRGKAYPPGGTYVGSKGGDSICLTAGNEKREISAASQKLQHNTNKDTPISSDDESNPEKSAKSLNSSITLGNGSLESLSSENMSPFGRAFYLGLAPYHVLGQFAILCYSAFLAVLTASFWDAPNLSSVVLIDFLIKRFLPGNLSVGYDVLAIFVGSLVFIAIFTTIQAVFASGIVIGSKWLLLGRRMPGNYDWDKSSYCQRWQVFLGIERLRRRCYQGTGIIGLLTGTNWIVLYFRALGAKIGKDCALFANGSPSLIFTEPDLITLGDRVAIDDASVVAHINSRGKFDLNQLEIGDGCVLRSGSRLLSGAVMLKDSCLLEHTLIMGGDVIGESTTMQGWPAEQFSGSRVKLNGKA